MNEKAMKKIAYAMAFVAFAIMLVGCIFINHSKSDNVNKNEEVRAVASMSGNGCGAIVYSNNTFEYFEPRDDEFIRITGIAERFSIEWGEEGCGNYREGYQFTANGAHVMIYDDGAYQVDRYPGK